MITVADIIVLMLAYAGLSLGGICLIWQLRTKPPSRGIERDTVGTARKLFGAD